MYGYELDELLKQYGLSNPSNVYGGTPMPTGPITIDNAAQQAAYEADQAKYQDYTKEYTNRLQNTNMYSAPQFQSPATQSDLYKKQLGNSVIPQFGTPAYENYTKNVNETLKNNPTTTQPELVALMDKYNQNRYDLVNATGSWWGDVLGNPNYQNYKAPETKPVVKDTVAGGATTDITVTPPILVDTITGGTGNDTITGGTGTSTITGGSGNDTITGSAGTSTGTVTGGSGNDTITGGTGTAIGTITGGTGNDTITGSTGTGTSGIETVTGGTGNDTITGGTGTGTGTSGTGTIAGGSGNDTITGGTGVDTTVPIDGSGITLTTVDNTGKPTLDPGATVTDVISPVVPKVPNDVMGPVSNNPSQAPQTVTLNDLVSGNPSTSPATGPYSPEQQKIIDDANQKAIDDANEKAKADAAAKTANNIIGPVSNNPNQAPQTVTLNDLVSGNPSNSVQMGPYTPEQQKAIDAKVQADAQIKADEQAKLEKEKSANNFVGPVSNAQNQNNQPATLDNLVSAYNINQPNSVQMGPYTQEQQKAIDATKTTTNDLANKYNVNDFVGPVSNTPNQSTSSNEINNLVSAYNINQPNSVQTGPYSPEQQKAIDAKNQEIADKLAKDNEKAIADAKAANDALEAANKAAADAQIKADQAAKEAAETAELKRLSEEKAAQETANRLAAEKAAAEAKAQEDKIAQEEADRIAKEAKDAEEKAIKEAKIATDKAAADAAAAEKARKDAEIKAEEEAKAAKDKLASDNLAAELAQKAQAEANAKANAEAEAAKAAEEANAKANAEAVAKAQAEALAKQQAEDLAKSLEAAKQTTADLANKYNINQISSDNLTVEKNPNQATVEQQGPYTPEQQKAIDAKQAQDDAAAKVQADKLAAENEKAQADAKAKNDAQVAAAKAAADAKAKADQAAQDAKETAAAKIAADKKAAADAKAQQLAEAKAKAETDKAAKAAADKAAAEAKAEAAKSAAAAKVAADKAASDAKAEAKAKLAAENKAKAEAKAIADKAASDAKAAAAQAAKEKAAADAEAKKQAAAEAKAKADAAKAQAAADAKAKADAAAAAKAIADKAALEKAQAAAIEKQKQLDAKAKANPTVDNLAAKYHVAPNVINAAKLLISDPTLNVENLRGQYAHIGSIEGFPRIYEIMDALKNKDSQPTKMPTVSEMAKNYNVSENAINAALLKTTDATDAEIKAYLKQHPVSANESKYLDGISRAIHSKMGAVVQNAANAAGGATTSNATTPAVVKPVEIAKTTPETTAKVTQIAQANDLAKQIVNVTKDTPNPVTPENAKVMAVEFITVKKPKEVTEQTLLDSLGNFAKMVLPGPAYVLDSLGNVIQGQAPMNPLDFARDIYSKDASIDIGSLIPDFLINWMNSGSTPATGEEIYDLGTMKITTTINDDGTHNFYTQDGNKLENYNQNNQGHIFSVSAPGSIKDSSGNPIGDGKSPVAVIKLPQTNQPTENFAKFVEDNPDDPAAIDQYIKDNGLETTHIAESIHSVKNNADLIAKFNAAANQGFADGTLQDGNLIGSELFPTTNAAIEALADGFVPLSLGINLIAEVKSIINGTNYNDELANESNIYNHWSAENPITSKLLQTLGVLGYSEITGGASPTDSMKVSSIWSKDLSDNGRSIAVNLSEGPITATPIDSKGNAIGETITLNQDRLGNTFLQDIGANIGKSVDDLIGSIEGTIGSIEDFFTPAEVDQETVNPIYDEAIKGITNLYDNPSFDYLGALAPSSMWNFPTIPNVTPGYADLSSANFWGSTLGNSYNTNFGDWGGSNIPTGWNLSDFGFQNFDYNPSPLNSISDSINNNTSSSVNNNANSNWSNNANNSSMNAGSNTLTSGGTAQYPGYDDMMLSQLGFLNRG